MMLLAAVSMGIPSGFSRYLAPDALIREERLLNVGIAILLLIAYSLYLWFSLGTHPGEFASAESGGAPEGTGKALGCPLFSSESCCWRLSSARLKADLRLPWPGETMDLTIGIALGSSIQIALFVAPMLVLASYFLAPQP